MSEPVNLREWKASAVEMAAGRLFTAGRLGRGTDGYKRERRAVDVAIIDRWVAGLPAAKVLYIVSLLGRKTDGFSEFAYYPFRSCRESGPRPTFQDWLNERYGDRFMVYEFPTTDACGIEAGVMEDLKSCLTRLLREGHTVLLIDSAGAERTARVCEGLGYER
jgi:hypothetical protein